MLAEITRLRRFCCDPQLVAPNAPADSAKLDAPMELIAELRDGRHRALVFGQFVDVLTLVRARLDAQASPTSTSTALRGTGLTWMARGDDVLKIQQRAGQPRSR